MHPAQRRCSLLDRIGGKRLGVDVVLQWQSGNGTGQRFSNQQSKQSYKRRMAWQFATAATLFSSNTDASRVDGQYSITK